MEPRVMESQPSPTRSGQLDPGDSDRRVTSKSLEPVVGGVLVGLGKGRNVVDRLDEVVDPAVEVEHGLSVVHEFGRGLAEDMDAEQPVVGSPEHELDEPIGVSRDH